MASDVELIDRYGKEGDSEAIGELFRQHSHMAYRTALQFMRNAADAEDAVQTAFVRIMRDAKRYRGGEGVKVWIMKVVIAACKMKIRENVRRRKREEYAMNEAEPSGRGEEDRSELAEQVKELVDGLPERYRVPIWLHHFEGLAFAEISAALATPEGTLRGNVSRGMEELRRLLTRRGMAMPMASLVALLPAIRREAVPATLEESIGDIVRETGKFREWVASAQRVSLETSRWPAGAKVAAVAAFVAVAVGGGMAVWWAERDQATPAMPPAEVGPKTGISRTWEFNAAEVSKELRVVQGGWRHVPDGGPDGSGCMETESEFTMILIDVPMESLPVIVSHRSTFVLPEVGGGWMAKTSWSGYRSMAHFNGLSKQALVKTIPGKNFGTDWIHRREYVTDRFIYQWHDLGHCELGVFERNPDAKLLLGFSGRHRIDDLTIRSIRPDEVPDANRFLEAVDAIPVSERKGKRPMPEFKAGRPGVAVTLAFDGAFSLEGYLSSNSDSGAPR